MSERKHLCPNCRCGLLPQSNYHLFGDKPASDWFCLYCYKNNSIYSFYESETLVLVK